MSEAAWWNAHGDTEAERNAYGDPPYDVGRAAHRLGHALQCWRGYNILDLGCGPGRTARALLELYPSARVVGVDVSERMIERCRSRAGPREHYLVGDGRHIPDVVFHDAYSITMFEHIPHDAAADYIHQIATRLPVGGRFMFTVTFGDEPQTFLHHQCTPAEIEGWCEDAGLEFVTFTTDDVLDDSRWPWMCTEKVA